MLIGVFHFCITLFVHKVFPPFCFQNSLLFLLLLLFIILTAVLTFKRQIKSHLPFEGIIRSSPYSTCFQDKG